MTLTEKAAYIKGLADGMKLGENDENRLLRSIVDFIEDVALSVADLEDQTELLGREVDGLYETLEEDEDGEFSDDDLFEVTCGKCGEKIYLDFEELEEGGISCPACGEQLEFDIPECDCEDDDCHCH